MVRTTAPLKRGTRNRSLRSRAVRNGFRVLCRCVTTKELSKKLVREWLEKWRFAGQADGAVHAQAVAEFFWAPREHQSHSLGIFRDELLGQCLDVINLEETFQDEVLSVFHATTLTFAMTGCVKLIEGSSGHGYCTLQQQVQLQLQQQTPPPQGMRAAGGPQGPLTRQQRRAIAREKQ